ncbi:purine-nucleoside phosphorylase [Sporolactobacillus sp. STCC-11]|uniref:purine-nucleoside phosphorylase n=1 Tax=Sporolactobacillus caesalpiniae TaxID=3230362 RepID=UPI0033970F07
MNMKPIEEVMEKLRKTTRQKPIIGLILGSGLGDLADEISDAEQIPYQSLPHFPESTVKGHKGQFVIGELEGKTVVAMQGRYHHYEGYSLAQVAFPVYVMKAMGIEKLIVTNACGGINTNFDPGDLMLITDHINMLGDSPLIGPNDDELGPRFPDMSHAYSSELILKAEEAAAELNIHIRKGVYLATHGPQYETPAEIRMMRVMGADAVGMSTVPEVTAASHLQLDVLGISCITNMACGILDQPLAHKEVIETAERVKADFTALIKSIIRSM